MSYEPYDYEESERKETYTDEEFWDLNPGYEGEVLGAGSVYSNDYCDIYLHDEEDGLWHKRHDECNEDNCEYVDNDY